MRKLLTIFLAVSFVLLLFISTDYSKAADTKTVVEGVNTYPVDVDAVQEAVDEYDRVILIGMFNFGEDGSVDITEDVEIVGEEGTTIRGGHISFRCEADVKLTVRDIRFENARYSAIMVSQSAGLKITGCTIRNVRVYAGPFFPKTAIPIYVTTFETPDLNPSYPEPELITGKVIIKDNYINPNVEFEDEYNAELGVGIAVAGINANVDISRNEVRNCNYGGISVQGILGTTTISNNIVHPGPPQDPVIIIGNGIYVGGSLAALFEIPHGNTYVSRNEVYCTNPEADGIVVDDRVPSDATYIVERNKVTMENTYCGALTCYYGTNNSVWSQNKVKGRMFGAIGVCPVGYTAEHNTFIGNNIARAETVMADVVLLEGANYNALVGHSGTVVDFGIGNIITGFTKKHLGPELGQALRDALARKKEAMDLF